MSGGKRPRLLSIIGTRPQYIKVKPISQYCEDNRIEHKIIDTRQHYSYNVSGSLIKDLNLKIDRHLDVKNSNEISFIAESSKALFEIINKESPNAVIVYGDTNSTFSAALAAYKADVPIAHVEAGERCFDTSVPEEVNRIFVDTASSLNFCSSKRALLNLKNGHYCGDLEYELLGILDPDIFFKDFGVMTIHRNENTSKQSLIKIFDFCKALPYDVRFFAHHRIRPYIDSVPGNVKILEPCSYSDMVKNMAECKFIITDSGGIQKTSAFFGKKTIVMRGGSEWKEVEQAGYARLYGDCKDDAKWLEERAPNRDKRFYLPPLQEGNPSGMILSEILRRYSDV